MPDGSYFVTQELDTTDRVIFGEAANAAPPAIRDAMWPILTKLNRGEPVSLYEAGRLMQLVDAAYSHAAAIDEVSDTPAPGKAHLFERLRDGALRFERVDLEEMSEFETVGNG